MSDESFLTSFILAGVSVGFLLLMPAPAPGEEDLELDLEREPLVSLLLTLEVGDVFCLSRSSIR